MTESSSPKKLSTILPLIIAGVGLVLLGVAAFALLPKPDSQPSTTEYSTIPLEVNYAAPDLSLSALDGTPTSLADDRGQVVLVNLWATWCPACKAEMPTLQSFYDKYKGNGFAVVAINDGDPTADVTQFVKDYALTFPVWLDPKYVATEQAFKSMNLPSSYVIDRNGVIRLQWVGEISSAMLEKYVTPLITE